MRSAAIRTLLVVLFTAFELNAMSVSKTLEEVLETHPAIQERLKFFQGVKEELKGSKSGYRPTVDLEMGKGIERVYNPSTGYIWSEAEIEQNRLILNQNIYEGLGTQNEIKKQEARIRSAYYSYYESVNDIMFETIEAYLNVLKNVRLLELAFDNVQKHKKIFVEIKQRNDMGAGIRSEIDRVAGRLAIAQSEYIMQKNAYKDSVYTMHKMLGRFVDGNTFAKPRFDIDGLPATLEEGLNKMFEMNPSLKVAFYNIQAQKHEYEKSKKEMRPKVDFELSKQWNENLGGVPGKDDSYRAMLKLKYNIYNGHTDNTKRQSLLSELYQQHETERGLKRDAVLGLELAWSGYRLLIKQQKYLKQNTESMKKVLKLYQKEFSLGNRSLINILDAESEYYESRMKYINTQYDFLLSKYRLLYSIGTLYESFEFEEEKSLRYRLEHEKRHIDYYDDDTLPVDMDRDIDSIVDNMDICPESLIGTEIEKSGCDKISTLEYLYQPLADPQEILRKNFVREKNDLQINKLKLNETVIFNYVTFKPNSLELTKKSKDIMRVLISQLKEFKSDVLAEITVHSRDSKDSDENYIISAKRAYNIKKILLMNEIESEKVAVFASNVISEDMAKEQTNYISIKIADAFDYSREDVTVIENDKIVFSSQSMDVSEDILDEIKNLSVRFATMGDIKVEIITHCGEYSSEAKNEEMSQKRASLLKALLIDAGLDGKKIAEFGIGNYEMQYERDSFGFESEFEIDKKPKNSVVFIIKEM